MASTKKVIDNTSNNCQVIFVFIKSKKTVLVSDISKSKNRVDFLYEFLKENFFYNGAKSTLGKFFQKKIMEEKGYCVLISHSIPAAFIDILKTKMIEGEMLNVFYTKYKNKVSEDDIKPKENKGNEINTNKHTLHKYIGVYELYYHYNHRKEIDNKYIDKPSLYLSKFEIKECKNSKFNFDINLGLDTGLYAEITTANKSKYIGKIFDTRNGRTLYACVLIKEQKDKTNTISEEIHISFRVDLDANKEIFIGVYTLYKTDHFNYKTGTLVFKKSRIAKKISKDIVPTKYESDSEDLKNFVAGNELNMSIYEYLFKRENNFIKLSKNVVGYNDIKSFNTKLVKQKSKDLNVCIPKIYVSLPKTLDSATDSTKFKKCIKDFFDNLEYDIHCGRLNKKFEISNNDIHANQDIFKKNETKIEQSSCYMLIIPPENLLTNDKILGSVAELGIAMYLRKKIILLNFQNIDSANKFYDRFDKNRFFDFRINNFTIDESRISDLKKFLKS